MINARGDSWDFKCFWVMTKLRKFMLKFKKKLQRVIRKCRQLEKSD